MGFFFNKNKKKYNQGLKDGAKPFEDKFNNLGNEISENSKQISQKMNQVDNNVQRADAVSQANAMNIAAINENFESTNKNIQRTGKNVVTIIQNLSDAQKKELFQLDSQYSVLKLSTTERQFLIGYLFTYSQEFDLNGLQKKYVSDLMKYLQVSEPQIGVKLDSIDNIESLTTQKIILEIVMEYCYLNNFELPNEEVFDLFSITKRNKAELSEDLQRMVETIGVEGLAERYEFQQSQLLDEKISQMNQKNQEEQARIEEQKRDLDKKLAQQQLEDEERRKQREIESKQEFDQIKKMLLAKVSGYTDSYFNPSKSSRVYAGITTEDTSMIEYRFKNNDYKEFTFDEGDSPSNFIWGVYGDFLIYADSKIYWNETIGTHDERVLKQIKEREGSKEIVITGKTHQENNYGETLSGQDLIDLINDRDKKNEYYEDDSEESSGYLITTLQSGNYITISSDYSNIHESIFGKYTFEEKSTEVARVLMDIGKSINNYYGNKH
ncbi:phage tail tape measure protein [Companilactobacillus kimchii]|uniref:TerB family tellurite resistance protein n=2 Tax=Companilactobacillus kimchii TaxID=2801452 RepID=A0ABR5NSW0_9LACO|nr:phage tail tape measure protein [Companilactobacillus kimchii]KAE9562128.1 hypothetical protein ATN91_05935 [Companilactobacillus kimchii]KRK51256.1 hypothetical protein FC97_GL000948 [Companilactobacillus kimchii DSM 13961 = JCM 10707]OWF34262.1 hypothetical protein LKACC12383_00175 [Companilactobacillus kimchii]GEO46178.1 hypothetical protein LKI01_01770 [Companilactobacillus paralimentarius]